jgi:hypothetical protein
MPKTEEILYAVVGAGDLAVQKARDATKITDRKTGERYYKDFVKRGRDLSGRIRNSGPTKAAASQTKTARRQVKAASTSVAKAAGANVKAARTAAKKVAKTS